MNIIKLIEELDKHIKIARTINEDTSDLVVTLRTLLAEENTAAASYTEKAKKLEGSVGKVLVESMNREDENLVTGRLENNSVVHFPGDASLIGSIVTVKLTECRGFYYFGEMVSE